MWDWLVRLLHWSLVTAIAVAWFSRHHRGPVHEFAGYAAGTIVLLRLVWGCIGSRYARFTQFVRSPRATILYLRLALAGQAPRHLGHNPLGGWMIVMLLSTVALLAITGWSLGTDALWGYAWPVLIHISIAWFLLVLVAGHLGGVFWTSWQHRENLIAAMFTGKKSSPAANDVD